MEIANPDLFLKPGMAGVNLNSTNRQGIIYSTMHVIREETTRYMGRKQVAYLKT
jgi:hypothetical protein